MDLGFEGNITLRGGRKRTRTENSSFFEDPETPSRSTINYENTKRPVHALKHESEQTPRRSGRKSIRPPQDYEEIVIGRNLRSSKKEDLEEELPKWTPSKVGRVSEKRPSRKSSKRSKKSNIFEQNEITHITADEVLNTTFDKSNEENNDEIMLMENTVFKELGVAPLIHGADEDDKTFEHVNASEKVSVQVEAVTTKCNESYDSVNVIEQFKKIHSDDNDEACSAAVTFPNAQLSGSEPTSIDAWANGNISHKCVEVSDNNGSHGIQTHQQEKISTDEDQEMPSLILCDDDDEGLSENQICSRENKGDVTFNASECVIVPTNDHALESVAIQQPILIKQDTDSPLVEAEKKVKEIQRKYFTPNKNQVRAQTIPQIVVTSAQQNKSKVFKSCTPTSVVKKTPSGTPISTAKRTTDGNATPRLNKSKPGYRFPTPFKSKINFDFSKTGKENSLASPIPRVPVITTLQPKEIVLRSIRKRSLSINDGEQYKRKAQNVTFYSPANQTATTEDLDQLMAKSTLKKAENNHRTKPLRKRSISLDENVLRAPSKLPKRVIPSKKLNKSPQKPTAKTKLPNFAAIHEKQYQKMENVVDYVARKAERAHNLTNSALKAKLAKLPQKTKPDASRALTLTPSNSKNIVSDKVQDNRGRHMAMFKGRAERRANSKLQNSELIKGVRSNRRFELLMQHRKTSGN